MRVLIADDHPLYLDAVQSQLERMLSAVETATVRSVADALARLAEDGPFELVLLDYSMPGMDGVAGLRQVCAATSAPAAQSPTEATAEAAPGGHRDLSSREIEVLTLLVSGASNKEIALKLDIQEVTVKLHATRIFTKLGVKSRAQAAVKALDEKLVLR